MGVSEGVGMGVSVGGSGVKVAVGVSVGGALAVSVAANLYATRVSRTGMSGVGVTVLAGPPAHEKSNIATPSNTNDILAFARKGDRFATERRLAFTCKYRVPPGEKKVRVVLKIGEKKLYYDKALPL